MNVSLDRRSIIIGCHRNRHVPDRDKIAKAALSYAAVLAEEKRHPDRIRGLGSSHGTLTGALTTAGKSCDDWVWTL